MQYIVS